jgi:hypothetical protein
MRIKVHGPLERIGVSMEMKDKDKNVYPFAQRAVRAKDFRQDYPISSELRQMILGEIFKDFKSYVIANYYSLYQPITKVFLDEHDIRPEKRQALEKNLFWWRLLYDNAKNVVNCVESYITENQRRLGKRPFFVSWLREFNRAQPKFYQVTKKHNDCSFVVTDILTGGRLEVIVHEEHAVRPLEKEVIVGTLLPIGGGVFFPVTDFYHFDIAAGSGIVKNLQYYYDVNSQDSPEHEVFIHVLSSMLQLERMIFLL